MKCFAHWMTRCYAHWQYSNFTLDKKSVFSFYWETNVTNLGLLKMKSVTKTLQAQSPASTKTSACPDPCTSSLYKDNPVKNPGSTSVPLSHTATPSTPPSIHTPWISRLSLASRRQQCGSQGGRESQLYPNLLKIPS